MRPYLKSLVPALGTLIAVAGQWVATGTFDRAEVATAITGGLSALLSYAITNDPLPEEGIE